MKPLNELIRKNVQEMKPYSSARNEFHGTASIFLDANENPWDTPYNRYPDPLQSALKARISELKGIAPESIFLGNGSDEAIDLLFRAFCEPAQDNVILIDPSYGMYEVCANLNNVPCKKVLLDETFDLDAPRLLAQVDAHTKAIFLCSPNNPTGNSLNREAIVHVLAHFSGLVVVDEAYIDFSTQPSFLTQLAHHPNLIVLQTLSKAWGAAAIRLGMAFASAELIAVFNKIKYPYNVGKPTQEVALKLLEQAEQTRQQANTVVRERNAMAKTLASPPYNYRVYPSDANFVLVAVGDANRAYNHLVAQGIVVRNRTNIALCNGCLRITVGTPEENNIVLEALKTATV